MRFRFSFQKRARPSRVKNSIFGYLALLCVKNVSNNGETHANTFVMIFMTVGIQNNTR